MTSENRIIPLQESRFGRFQLTDAIRPSIDLPIIPREAYRVQIYRNPQTGFRVPTLAASISAERLFELFLDILKLLGETVDVVLETSHEQDRGTHADLHREYIDRAVLESYLCDFEDLLLNDGCTGIAVASTDEPIEVQFDEHKLLIVYASDLGPFASRLSRSAICRDDRLRLISEANHFHRTSATHRQHFNRLAYRMGVSEAAEWANW